MNIRDIHIQKALIEHNLKNDINPELKEFYRGMLFGLNYTLSIIEEE